VVRAVVGSFAGVVVVVAVVAVVMVVFIEEVAGKGLESGRDGFNGLLGLVVPRLENVHVRRVILVMFVKFKINHVINVTLITFNHVRP